MTTDTRNRLLETILDEVRKGEIYEATLTMKGWHLRGLCDPNTGRVYVDPAPVTVETLMHEILHRRYPRWGENRVDLTAKRLLASMSSDEVKHWYRLFRRVRKTTRKPVSYE